MNPQEYDPPILDIRIGGIYAIEGKSGRIVEVVQFESAVQVLVRDVASDSISSLPADQLRALTSKKTHSAPPLETLSQKRIKEAKARLEAITPLLEYSRIPKDVLQERAKELGVAPKTLRGWVRRFRDNERLTSLARKRRSDASETRISPLVEPLLQDTITSLLNDSGLSIAEAYRDLEDTFKRLAKDQGNSQLRCPSYGTLYARYRALPEIEKTEARLGKRLAKLAHGLGRGSISGADHPLALVQVDHLEVPVVVVDETDRLPIGKPWITVLIDLFSRCITGYYLTLESPGNLSLGLAMSHSVLPKEECLKQFDIGAEWPVCGIPWCVHADNAGEFHGNMLELAAHQNTFELTFRKVKQPQYGAHIESYLGTLSEKLQRVPGSTRTGPDELGDNDPSEAAVMTLRALEEYILRLICEYHGEPHSGIDGTPPLERFREGMRGGNGVRPIGRLRVPTNKQKFLLDFLPCDERVVGTKGIQWDHIWYSDDCLQDWVDAKDPSSIRKKRKFLVRRDPRDLSRIYFWDPAREQYLTIPTRNMSRPAISIWELSAVRRWMKQKGIELVDEESLFESREKRRALVENERAKTTAAKRRRARTKAREKLAKKGATETASTVKPPEPPMKTRTEDSDEYIGVAYESEW